MKIYKTKQPLLTICFLVLSILFVGCDPKVREVTERLYGIPLGTCREQVIKNLIAAFGDRLPDYLRDSNQYGPPLPVTENMIKTDTKLISDFRTEHRYVRVHPSSLYEKMPRGALTEPIGIVTEASEGNGSVSIFYDSHTNYIGFLSFTSGNDR